MSDVVSVAAVALDDASHAAPVATPPAGHPPPLRDERARSDVLSRVDSAAADERVKPFRRRNALMLGDLLAVLAAGIGGWVVAGALRSLLGVPQAASVFGGRTDVPAILFLTTLLLIFHNSRLWGHYTRFKPFWSEVQDVVRVVGYVIAVDALLLFVWRYEFSRLWLICFWIGLIFAVPAGRVLVRRALIARNRWFTPTIVIGNGANARTVAEALQTDDYLGHHVVGFVDPTDTESLDRLARERCIGSHVIDSVGSRERDVAAQDVAEGAPTDTRPCPVHLMFAFDTIDELEKNRTLIDRLAVSSSCVTLAPPIQGFPLYGSEVLNIFRRDTVLLRLHNNLRKPWPRIIKRTFDLSVASGILIAIAPLLALLYVLVRLDGGPAFYGHPRRGEGSRRFYCLKFRSMTPQADEVLARHLANNPDAAAEWRETFKLKNDPRITRIGHWLRRTSLDELPQLFNVVRGDMSLVGPRPIIDDEIERYAESYEYYKAAKPGITGIWQVSGRNDVSYEERVNLDRWYVKNWSLWTDVVILIKTVPIVLKRSGAY